MGCLSLRVIKDYIAGCLSVKTEHIVNDVKYAFQECNSIPSIKFGKEGGILNLLASCVNAFLSIKTKNCNSYPSAIAHNLNSPLTINAGLVCSTGLGMWEVFYVKEGPLIVEEGYFKVLKDR